MGGQSQLLKDIHGVDPGDVFGSVIGIEREHQADQAAHEFACRDCERLAAATRQGTLTQKVLEQLGAIEGEYPTLESMARTLSVSGRTLIRRLKAEGTSYQRLLDDVRLEKAQWYLLNTRYPIEEIAARVGFVKTANFSRTFKRWHGMTPSQARSMAPSA